MLRVSRTRVDLDGYVAGNIFTDPAGLAAYHRVIDGFVQHRLVLTVWVTRGVLFCVRSAAQSGCKLY